MVGGENRPQGAAAAAGAPMSADRKVFRGGFFPELEALERAAGITSMSAKTRAKQMKRPSVNAVWASSCSRCRRSDSA